MYWKEILVISLLVSFAMFTGYNKVKAIGYDEAATKYEAIINEQKALIDTKIVNVEKLASTLVVETKHNNENLAKDIKSIVKGFNGKTLTIVKEGECYPSPTFSDSFVLINARTNETLKGLQK